MFSQKLYNARGGVCLVIPGNRRTTGFSKNKKIKRTWRRRRTVNLNPVKCYYYYYRPPLTFVVSLRVQNNNIILCIRIHNTLILLCRTW